ncbi:MAG: hypothetical protein U9N53_04035 [Bacteroidota bacterium]|nr:hypothetical protein [Bacteroidota bacterium]
MKKLAILGVGLLILLTACNTNRTDTDKENIDKLLDSQAEMQKVQEESVNQLDRIKDSLTTEKESMIDENKSLIDEKRLLIDQRDSKDKKIQQMEKNQQILAEKLKEEETFAASSEKTALEERIDRYEDSITLLKYDLSLLDTQLDSIEESMNLYVMQESRTEKSLESGIAEIDQRMTSREVRKQQEIKRVALLGKRIVVSGKKIETYALEQQLYLDERDDMRRSNASEEELAPYEKRIAEMDDMIQTEKENKKTMEEDVEQAEVYISETDALMDQMNAQIQEEYDKKEVIEAFIASEKERLQRELGQIQMTRKELLAEQATISKNLANTEEQIARIDRNVELIKNKEMSEILEKQAAIEHSEAELAEEEISLIEEGSGLKTEAKVTKDSAGEGLLTLLILGNELDSLNNLIQAEKSEIAKTRKDLSEKRAEAASQRARLGRTIGGVFIFLIIGGVALLALFYYLGKRSRKS